MRDPSQHILFVATEFDAPGMRPYARQIINALWQSGDKVLIVSRYGADEHFFPDIPADGITWIDYPTSLTGKAIFRFYPKRVLIAIDEIIETHSISLIFSLTEELILSRHINLLQQRVQVLYTVHDATFHDYKSRSPIRWLKNRLIIARPQRLMLERTLTQVTNSQQQINLIKERFPYHKVHYFPFPSLVNDDIINGRKTVDELRGVDDGYILFFGTLHLYKGVHLLYDAYHDHPELQNRELVIAGTGSLYFARRANEGNVTIINRFVDDSELGDLFGRASVVVYPYTSATQSGVTSIASYFGKPMVLSDLPFFKETCPDREPGVEFFTHGDANALAQAIIRSTGTPATTRDLYQRLYSPGALRDALDNILASFH